MKVLLVAVLLGLACPWLVAGTLGSFRGTIVRGPDQSSGWIYVEGRNHTLRRVNASGAKVEYESDVPAEERKKPIPKVLPLGTPVRVTAEQDDGGEWHATEIEILKAEPPSDDEKKLSSPTTSQS